MMDLENFVFGILSEHENFEDVGFIKRRIYIDQAIVYVEKLQRWIDNPDLRTWDEMTKGIEDEIKFFEGELEKIGKPVLLPTTKSSHGARAKSQFPEYLKNLCALRYLQLRLAERRQTSGEPGNQAGKVKIESGVNFRDLFNYSPDSDTAINALKEEITLKYNSGDVKISVVNNTGSWVYEGKPKASLIVAFVDSLIGSGKLKKGVTFLVVYKSVCNFFHYPEPAKEPEKARKSDVYRQFQTVFSKRI